MASADSNTLVSFDGAGIADTNGRHNARRASLAYPHTLQDSTAVPSRRYDDSPP